MLGKSTFSPKLFITDDDSDDRDLISEALLSVREDVVLNEFRNGKQLIDYLELAGEGIPDVIILDINMPIKGGLETLQELKASGTWSRIPVVMLSTSSKAIDEAHFYHLGASKFYSKPSNFEDYLALAAVIISFASDTTVPKQ